MHIPADKRVMDIVGEIIDQFKMKDSYLSLKHERLKYAQYFKHIFYPLYNKASQQQRQSKDNKDKKRTRPCLDLRVSEEFMSEWC